MSDQAERDNTSYREPAKGLGTIADLLAAGRFITATITE